MLSLHVAAVNAGISASALTKGLQVPACVRSVEDHGFLLTLGIQVCNPQHPLMFCVFPVSHSYSVSSGGHL